MGRVTKAGTSPCAAAPAGGCGDGQHSVGGGYGCLSASHGDTALPHTHCRTGSDSAGSSQVPDSLQARSFFSYPDFLHNRSQAQRGSGQELSTAAVPGWALGWLLGEQERGHEQPRAHTQAQGHKTQLSVLWEGFFELAVGIMTFFH